MKKMYYFRQLLQEAKEFLEYILIPLTGVLLPYSVGLKWFKLVARLPWLYETGLKDGFENAIELNLIEPRSFSEWKRRVKVSLMIDHADVFFLLTRGEKYYQKNVQHNFDGINWNKVDMIFFPHYGAGSWILFTLSEKSEKNYLLVNPIVSKKFLPKNWARTRLYQLRSYVLNTKLKTTFISPGDLLTIRKVLQKKEIILVSADMPINAQMKSYQADTPLGKLNVAASFFDLAERRKLNVVNVTLGFSYSTGKREYFAKVSPEHSAEAHVRQFTDMTAEAIQKRPWLWRMMPLAKELIIK